MAGEGPGGGAELSFWLPSRDPGELEVDVGRPSSRDEASRGDGSGRVRSDVNQVTAPAGRAALASRSLDPPVHRSVSCIRPAPPRRERVSGESIRERLSALSRAEIVGLIVVLAVTIGGAGLWYVRSLPSPVEVRATASAPTGAMRLGGESIAGPPLLVDVAGWVRRPGVYTFAEGSRVIDAIEAAGGARPGGAPAGAEPGGPAGRRNADPRAAGEGRPALRAGGEHRGGARRARQHQHRVRDRPRGPARGSARSSRSAIIDHRTANGPFTSVDQLVDVSGIGDAILDSIRELVTV